MSSGVYNYNFDTQEKCKMRKRSAQKRTSNQQKHGWDTEEIYLTYENNKKSLGIYEH